MGPRKRGYVFIMILTIIVATTFIIMTGCKKSEEGNNRGKEDTGIPSEDQTGKQDDSGTKGPITLTLYFAGDPQVGFYLMPEKRQIPYTTGVARAAMEELIKGPAAGSSLRKVLPNTVKVLDIKVSEGICTLNLSKEILTDAVQVGVSAGTESNALNAIANTLTEFPTIKKVKLLIEGKSSGMVDGWHVEDFWGHIGLPDYLERNETVIGPPKNS